MTTIYSNTKRPVLMKSLMWGCIVCAVACIAVVIIIPDRIEGHDTLLIMLGMWFPYAAWWFKHYKSQTITIVKYKRSFRGRYRCLYIHDDSVRFFDIFAPMRTAVRIRHHLKKLNPDIKP